jgi:hypothetical protein
VVLIRKGTEPVNRPLPDGFEELAAHNLVTFKSHQEAMDPWALWELVGHFVNYRKQSSPSLDTLLPEADYRLFAVSTRYPDNLARRVALREVRAGVYDLEGFGLRVRLIVLNQLPPAEQNAMLMLFSNRLESVRYGRDHYRSHSPDTSTLLLKLFNLYEEDPEMVDKLKEFVRQTREELFQNMTAEERRKVVQSLPADERLKGLPAEERLKGLSAEEVARALPPEVLAALAQQLKANGAPPKPET